MKSLRGWGQSALVATLLLTAACPQIVGSAQAADIKDGIPADVFLAVYGKQNPERDYQKAHYQAIWDEVEKSNIIDRVMKIVQSKASDGDLEQMLAVRDTLFKAVEPVQWDKLADMKEVVMGQKLEGPFHQTIAMMRFPADGAASLIEGVTNLFNLAEDAANGNLSIETETHEGVAITTLRLPPQVPLSPSIGIQGDLIVFSTSPDLLKRCVTLMNNPSAESKFDDPRVAAALAHLPEAEDALVFFDGVTLNQQLNGIVSFIQGVGANDDNAMRVASLMSELFKQVNICDHEVSVQYTDGYRNLSATFGKSSLGVENTVLGQMVASQNTFSDWKKWVPENASSFNLNGGANMHPLYEWVTTKVPEMFPESKEGFAKFDAIQDQFDLHLDADIFQSFSGESVNIAMPGPPSPFGQTSKSVSFMRCEKPDRVEELISRGIDALMQIPQVQQQGVQIVDSTSLDGFKEIKANMFMMLGGISPVYGMSDGLMTMGSHADAVQTVMLTKGGEGASFADSDKFKEFGMDVEGDVYSISYSNTGESIRQAAAGMQQVGAMLPMIMMSMGNQGGNGPDMEPIKDLLALMPTVGRIVAKFDFIDANLSVSKPGPTDGTYIRHTVTTIRPPAVTESAN